MSSSRRAAQLGLAAALIILVASVFALVSGASARHLPADPVGASNNQPQNIDRH
jgi:hypothetical protein